MADHLYTTEQMVKDCHQLNSAVRTLDQPQCCMDSLMVLCGQLKDLKFEIFDMASTYYVVDQNINTYIHMTQSVKIGFLKNFCLVNRISS